MPLFRGLKDKMNKNNNAQQIEFPEFKEEVESVDVEEEEAVAEKVAPQQESANVKMMMMTPAEFSELYKIADYAIKGYILYIDVSLLERSLYTRMLDFLQGVLYTTKGTLTPRGQNIYVVTPEGVDVQEEC